MTNSKYSLMLVPDDAKTVRVEVSEKELFKSLLAGDVKLRLEEIESARIRLDIIRDNLLEATWDEYWSCDHAVPVEWECPNSPFGYCAYHKWEDRAWDHCLFCGEPHERK